MNKKNSDFISGALVILTLVSVCFLVYSYVLNKSQKELKADFQKYTLDIQAQKERIKDLEKKNKEVKKSQEVRSQDFLTSHGIEISDLNNISIDQEISNYKESQEDLIKQVHTILSDEIFQKDFYESDDFIIFLGKYTDLSSKATTNKLRANIWQDLKGDEILNLILKDSIYQSFYRQNNQDSPALKAGILHQASLGYDVYKLSQLNLKNLDDSRIVIDLYVDGIETLQKKGLDVSAFNPSKLQNYREKTQELYAQYLEFEGILNQLEELKNEEEK